MDNPQFSRHVLEKISTVKFLEDQFTESRVVPCRYTDLMKFRSFTKAPNNSPHYRICKRFPSLVCRTAVQMTVRIWGVLGPVFQTLVPSVFLCGFRSRSNYWKFLLPTYQFKFIRIFSLRPQTTKRYFWIMHTSGRNLEIVFFFRLHPVIYHFIHNLILYATFVGVRSLMLRGPSIYRLVYMQIP